MSYIPLKRGNFEITSDNAMVVAKHPLAALAGIEILKKGGNAVDAAVATNLALGVVEPFMTGLGGGGDMAIRLSSGEIGLIDFWGKAPSKASPDMFELEPEGETPDLILGWPPVKDDANIIGHRSVLVPGMVAGLHLALEKYGTMGFEEVAQPAIKLAEEGFQPNLYVSAIIGFTMDTLRRFPETAKTFLPKGLPPKPWYLGGPNTPRLRQRDLAESLRKIGRRGPEVFYKGELAEALVREMEEHGGLITEGDLANYTPRMVEADPVPYRGYEVIYIPWTGGTTVVEILNILEGFDPGGMGYNSPRWIHLLCEAMKLGFIDSFRYMGPWVEAPLKKLVSKDYAASLRERIDPNKAMPALNLHERYFKDTTHMNVVDKDRNTVSSTTSHGMLFGSNVTVPGTGIILNDLMIGFDPTPGRALSIKGGAEPWIPSAATLLLKDGQPFLATGSPGGRRIISAVARVITNIIDYGMGIQAAIDAPRLDIGDRYVGVGDVYLEASFPDEVIEGLKRMGHQVVVEEREWGFGHPNGILIDQEGRLHGGVEHGLPHGLAGTVLGY